jgi:thiol-disulfide isomerase/thioredoxin
MKKGRSIGTAASTMILLVILVNSCGKNENPNNYLTKVLNNLEEINSATYYQSLNVFDRGDTIPYGTRFQYFKEYINPADTFVGASFLEYMGFDTSKIVGGYDGNYKASIDWDKKTIRTSDFQNNPYPFRVIPAPFITFAKTIIKYALETQDSINIVSNDYGDSVLYSISFYDEYLEFLGKIPVPVYEIPGIPDGSAKGKSCRYDIWIDKSNSLPYKIKRDMVNEISVHHISNIKISDKLINDLTVASYFPPEFPLLIKGNQNAIVKELEGKKAPNLELCDFNNDTISYKNLKSKILMLEFTGIGCGPCYQAIPFLRQLVIDNKNKDFQFISIEAFTRKNDLVKSYHARNDLNYDLLISSPDILEKYHINLVPVFIILDENRVIKKVFEGYEKGTTDKMIIDAINELI